MEEKKKTDVCKGEKDEKGNEMEGTRTDEATPH